MMGLLSEEYPYDELSKNPTAELIADVIRKSKGGMFANDKEAWAEAAFNSINNISTYLKVEKLLGEDPYKFISDFMDVSRKYHIKSISDHYKNFESYISSGGRLDGNELKVSQQFWDWIKYHEGDVKKKGEPVLKTYKDINGVYTIGYGHTGESAKLGNIISKSEALNLLYKDAKEAADCLRRLTKEWKNSNKKGYFLKQNEFDALVSIIFNGGCNGLRTSDITKPLSRGNYEKAAQMILKYKSEKLKNRRMAEFSMFKNGEYLKK